MIVANAFESFELHVNSTTGVFDLEGDDGISLNVFPNPFNDRLQIEYRVNERSKVRVAVYDMLGKVVEILDEKTIDPGSYSVEWDASFYPAGAYIIKLQTNRSLLKERVLLIR